MLEADLVRQDRLAGPGRASHDVDRAFEEAALEAVRRYKFAPGRKNGEAVDVRVKLPVLFTIDAPDEDFQLDSEAKDRSGIKYEMFEVDRPPRVLRVFPNIHLSQKKKKSKAKWWYGLW